MNIAINISPILDILSLPADVFLLKFFMSVGWIPIGMVLVWGFYKVAQDYWQISWGGTQKFIFLAIDIPRNNAQSPLAVENMFTYFAGAHKNLNPIEKYWTGKYQLGFSFEIASIEGYTQFVIRTPLAHRNLTETAIYSQYPDAEITEVSDYTLGYPRKFPDDEYDLWGTEYVLVSKNAFPIKTYPAFEHKMGEPETHFRDPMASLMDLNSSMRTGEQLWTQIIITPINTDWVKECEPVMKKIIDEAKSPFGTMSMNPVQKAQVEGIQKKLDKTGFKMKYRVVYIAKKEVINKPKVSNGYTGYIKQFALNYLNALKPEMDIVGTSENYLFKAERLAMKKTKIMKNFCGRSGDAGNKENYMNIEELATLWHFPIESSVKAPLIQKSPGRKSEPPVSLPLAEDMQNPSEINSAFAEDDFKIEIMNKEISEDISGGDKISQQDVNKISAEDRGTPPENLPFA